MKGLQSTCRDRQIRTPWAFPLWVFAIAFALLDPITATAQSNNDGSLYSRFGIGELRSFGSSQIQAMGNAGFGMHSLNYANLTNPGTWADQVLTRASAGFTYQNIRISNAAGDESRLASGYLNGVQFSFPLLERKLGVALGFVPYSKVSYRVQESGTYIMEDPEPDTLDFTIDFVGSGGLQNVTGGFGYRFSPSISVGVSLNGIFGIVENGRRTSFIGADPDFQFVDTNVRSSTQLFGLSGTIGMLLSTTRLFGEEDFISFGAAFTTPSTLSGDRVRTLGEDLDRDTLGTAVSGDVRLPWRLAAGAAYQPNPRWMLVAGGRYEPWTQFESDLPFPGYTPDDAESDDRLADRIQGGAGVEFMPAGADQLASYFARVAYRFGVYYDRSYISPDARQNIATMALTGGLSLPTRMSGTRLDVNIQVGTRGSTEGNLVRDVFYRLSANVNIGERWFQTPKLR